MWLKDGKGNKNFKWRKMILEYLATSTISYLHTLFLKVFISHDSVVVLHIVHIAKLSK